MPRSDNGYDSMNVCGFCIEFLTGELGRDYRRLANVSVYEFSHCRGTKFSQRIIFR